jgi:uncharacterized lipoprotein (TIGR02269 family)
MYRMSLPMSKRWPALLGLLLTACATTFPTGSEGDETLGPTSSWEEARTDPSCVVPLCDEVGCGLWRCLDLVEVDPHAVVLARGPVLLRPPMVGSPSRWWGRSLAAPTRLEPVFEIPWRNWKTRNQPTFKDFPLVCLPPREPLEKHHIFPQQRELAIWFRIKNIDIHAYTLRLPKSFHSWLHSGGSPGGQWNEAWRQFKEKNDGASPEEIWRFAFELMARFGVNGPLVPYYCQ